MLVSAVRAAPTRSSAGPSRAPTTTSPGTAGWCAPSRPAAAIRRPLPVSARTRRRRRRKRRKRTPRGRRRGRGGHGDAAGEVAGAGDAGRALLDSGELHQLARLARRAEQIFGGPQDIEFGFDADGRLWLFQSRPITAMAARPPRGARLLGPGPVAETLPDALQPLEEDLWVVPMARGLTTALDIGASAPAAGCADCPSSPPSAAGRRPTWSCSGGGAAPPTGALPAEPDAGLPEAGRRLARGRLRLTLPQLAVDLLADVDRGLVAAPALRELTPPNSLGCSGGRAAPWSPARPRGARGALLHDERSGTAAADALAALAAGRARG
ncbi:PEP/pyruvate-binding domain-containing protein [Streptomyces sp. M19]